MPCIPPPHHILIVPISPLLVRAGKVRSGASWAVAVHRGERPLRVEPSGSIVIAGMAGIGAERKLDSEIAGFRFCP